MDKFCRNIYRYAKWRAEIRREGRAITSKWLAALAMALFLTVFSACALAEAAHYLLVGVDGWGINEEGAARSDAIILVSLDYDRDAILLTSFARDSIVKPSYRKGTVKINTLVRSSEGEHMLAEYLEEAFGLDIQGSFFINFSGTVDLINAIGGVKLRLSADEVDYIRHHAGDYYGYPLSEGECRLNGAQALYYMRCRNLDNDFGRQGRQGKVLRAVMNELSGITPLRALGLLDDVLGMYRTDLSGGRQIELALRALKLLDADVAVRSLPAEGTYRYGEDSHGTSGLVFDLDRNRELFYKWLGEPNPFEEKEETETEKAPAAA